MFNWLRKRREAKAKQAADQAIFENISKKLEGYQSDGDKSVFLIDSTDSEWTNITLDGVKVRCRKKTMESDEPTWWEEQGIVPEVKDPWDAIPDSTQFTRDNKRKLKQ